MSARQYIVRGAFEVINISHCSTRAFVKSWNLGTGPIDAAELLEKITRHLARRWEYLILNTFFAE